MGEYELVMLSKYGAVQGGETACAKIWIEPTSHLVWLEKIFENKRWEMSLHQAYFFFLDSLPPVPFPSYSLISLPYFSSLHSCDLLGAKDAREKVASPQCLTYRILLMQVPHGKLGAIFYLETFQPYTADPAAASLPHYPLRGHLHGNKWFLHFVL